MELTYYLECSSFADTDRSKRSTEAFCGVNDETANAVLILSTTYSINVPMLVDFDGQSIFLYIKVRWFLGNTNQNLAFEYEDGAIAYGGCGVTLNGEFLYFGGSGTNKNVSLSLIRFQNLESMLHFLSEGQQNSWL